MNTKTLDNTANDPWADIAHSDLVNYVRNTGHFPADGYQTPKPQISSITKPMNTARAINA